MEKRLTLPNLISIARICLIPPFIICLMEVREQSFYRYISLGMLLIIGLSDVLDGYLARRRGETTQFGKYLDPIADKLTLIIACVLLSSDKLWPEPRFPNWVPAIIICRELLISLDFIVAFIILKRNVEWCPSRLGRLAVFLQITAIMAILVGNNLPLAAHMALWWSAAAVTMISAVCYTYRGAKQL